MANSGYKVVIKQGNYAFKQPSLNLPGLDLERSLLDYMLAKHLAANPTGDCCTLVTKVQFTQTLSGNTLVTHNLNLPTPFITNVEVRNSAGLQVLSTVTLETANTVTINAGALTNASIIIS